MKSSTSLGLLLMLFAPVASTSAAPPTTHLIRSAAELESYMHSQAMKTSPLMELSPGGRKRFLNELPWAKYGFRGSIPLDDATNELTYTQIVQLFGLFGWNSKPLLESLKDAGLTPAARAQQQRERIDDAAARHCSVEMCPETDIERRYDELVQSKPDFSLPDAKRMALDNKRYDRLFGTIQSAPLDAISRPDLRLLKRAVERTLLDPDPKHIAQLTRDLAEMQRRGMVEDADFKALYAAEVSARQFADAAALRKEHPGMHVAALPAFVTDQAPRSGQPTVLSIDTHSNTMRRQAVDLGAPLRIVVIAGCHFSEDAAHAIEGDAQLRPLFAQHAIWLANPAEQIDDVSAWNRQFPDFPMHVAWSQDEWSMLPNWGMPTYYVYRNGQLVKQFSGWLGTARLKQSLHEAGAL